MLINRPITHLELTTPCCLPLGAVQADGRPTLLGAALQYPPINLVMRSLNELSVTGARAPVARAQAQQWFESHNLPPKAEIEIELAIPAHMGLGSEAMMGMSVGRGLRDLAGLGDPRGLDEQRTAVGLGAEWALEAWSASQGGLHAVGLDGTSLQRHAVKHDDDNAWVFVIHLPRAPADTPPSFEHTQRLALIKAASLVQADAGPMWAALATNDLPAFAKELMTIQERTTEALSRIGAPVVVSAESQRMIEVIKLSGAPAWGQSFGGLAVWGLVHGAKQSQDARLKMRRVMGYEGGTITAAVVDNDGVKIKTN
jgi:predicted sugar kinase